MTVAFEGMEDLLEITEEDDFSPAPKSFLGAEPLTTEELQDIESHAKDTIDLDEPMEGAFEVFRKSTEAKLPIDRDAADVIDSAADAHFIIRDRL